MSDSIPCSLGDIVAFEAASGVPWPDDLVMPKLVRPSDWCLFEFIWPVQHWDQSSVVYMSIFKNMKASLSGDHWVGVACEIGWAFNELKRRYPELTKVKR